MNKTKRFSLPICLALLGIGVLLLGAWDIRSTIAAPIPETWNQGSDLSEAAAFYGSAQCPDDPDSFYVVAGWQAWFDNRDEVWRYDANTSIWEELALYPEEMGVPSVTCYQGYLYAVGGNLEGVDTSWHFYRYEIASDNWTQLPDLLRKQNGAALVAWDGYLYMIGGDDAPAVPLSPTTQVDRYNIGTGIWEMNWGNPMPVATMGNWVQAGKYVYIVGGFTSNFPTNSDATLRYDLTNGTWESGPSFTSRRAMMALTLTSQYLYAIGGDANGGGSSDETNQVERLDLSDWPGGSWVDIADPLSAPRAANGGFCTEAVTGGEIWSVAGLDLLDDPTTNIFFRPSEPCSGYYYGDLQPESLAITATRGTTVTYTLTIHNDGTLGDTYDISHSAIWNTTYPATIGPLEPGESAELLVSVEIPADAYVGDSNIATITATSQGDPTAADEATLTTTVVTEWVDISAEVPSAVLGYGFAQCLEQPNNFYIFGGRPSDLSFANEVWRYDAVFDTWTELEPMGIEAVGVAAVCYQGDIYVAGGASAGVYDTFAIYHIATDSWALGPDLPQRVFFASVGIWDGKLYLVGGTTSGDPWPPTDDVQIYDIVTQSWSDIPGSPMPFPAFGAGYVQTGSYLWIVGGGSGSYDYVNRDTTQRYDMATDTWTVQHDFTSQRAVFALAASATHLYALGGDETLGWVFEPTDLVETLDLQIWPNTGWESFYDPLPQPTIYNSTGFCSEVKTGGEVWSVAGATGASPNPIVLDDTLYHPAEPCVSYGVDLPEPWQGKGAAGETVEYTLTITNTGVVTDYYTLDVSTTWDIGSLMGGPGPIGPGESMDIAIAVEVPSDAMWGDQGVTDITAASISNPAEFDTTTITTQVLGYQVDVNPDPPDPQAGHPGEVLTYTLWVSNIGDFVDSYTVTISTIWGTVTPISVGPLLPGEETELVVTVEIPQDAMHADWDVATITLTSQADPRVSHSVELTSAAFWHRMLIPLALRN